MTLKYNKKFDFPVDSLPPSLLFLELGKKFNKPVDRLPPSLTHLHFGRSFNHLVDHLPSSLKVLSFGNSFNFPVYKLPLSLTDLSFGEDFNHPVDNLPKSLKNLSFGNSFNHPIDKLPSLISSLRFGSSFNHPIKNLPSSLRHLTFGNSFNSPIHSLPHSLLEIYFGDDFNQLINLPNIEKLKLGRNFKSKIELPITLRHLTYEAEDCPMFQLPPNLQNFKTPFMATNITWGHLPSTLQKFTIGNSIIQEDILVDNITILEYTSNINIFLDKNNIPKLPSKLESLHFTCLDQNTEQEETHNLVPSLPLHRFSFPPNLHSLTFGSGFNEPINILPQSLHHINFMESCFDHPISSFPPHLETLQFNEEFNQPINLPDSLTCLSFGDQFDQPIPQFPSKLISLKFGSDFNQPISSFPSFLKNLTLGCCFNHPLPSFPHSLVELSFLHHDNWRDEFCVEYEHSLTLPPYLRSFYFGKCLNQPVLNNFPPSLEYLGGSGCLSLDVPFGL